MIKNIKLLREAVEDRFLNDELTYSQYNALIDRLNEIEFYNEKTIINTKDIYYNKDKFDSGKINICFITGHSGSGKSTMGRDMNKNQNIEHFELDDVISNWNFSDTNLKEYGDLIYTFFKKYKNKYRYYSHKEWIDDTYWDEEGHDYDKEIVIDFVNHSIKYANTHKKIKFVIEGIQLFKFIEPSKLKDYAVYIKGTSMLISKIRAARRDSKDTKGINRVKSFTKMMKRKWKTYSINENEINRYRNYFSNLN